MKSHNIIFLSIMSLLGMTACTQSLQQTPRERYFLNIAADMSSTRVSVLEEAEGRFQTQWTNNESAKVVLNYGSGVEAADGAVSTVDHLWADLSAVHNAHPESQSFTYYAVLPASNYVSASEDGTVVVNVPSEQSPELSTYDQSACVVVGESQTFTTQQGGSAEEPRSIDMSFRYTTALGKFSITGYPQDENLLQVNIISVDKTLSGKMKIAPDGSLSEVEAGKTVSINLLSPDRIWFACYPAELENWSVELITNKGKYTQTISRKLSLAAGKVAQFSVNMEGAVFSTIEAVKYSRTISPELKPECVILDAGTDIQGYLVKGIWRWNYRGATFVFDDVPASGEYRVKIFTYFWESGDTSVGVAVNIPSPAKEDYTNYTLYASDRSSKGTYTLAIDNVSLVKGKNTIKVTRGEYMGSDWFPNVGPVTVTNEHLFQNTEQTSN